METTNMNKKLNWDEIRNTYSHEWVELIEYEWHEFEPKPRAGIVIDHAKNRKNKTPARWLALFGEKPV